MDNATKARAIAKARRARIIDELVRLRLGEGSDLPEGHENHRYKAPWAMGLKLNCAALETWSRAGLVLAVVDYAGEERAAIVCNVDGAWRIACPGGWEMLTDYMFRPTPYRCWRERQAVLLRLAGREHEALHVADAHAHLYAANMTIAWLREAERRVKVALKHAERLREGGTHAL